MKHFLSSRKWAAAVVGIGCVGMVYATGLAAVIFCDGSKAQYLVGLANMAVVFLGAITGSLVTGQSFVDWRHGSSTMLTSEERRMTSEVRVYAPKHFDEEERGGGAND